MDDHEQEETSCRTSDHIETKTKHESSKKSKRRKTEKSQKYAILPPVVVTNIAESIGIDDLPENVSSALAEDATFKLRELISNCATLLKNQRRKKLLTEDVNRVLEIADVGRIYGHNATDECGFTFIEDAGIYIQEDHKVDVVAMALNDLTLTQKKVQCITGTRVVLDPVEQRKEKTGDGHAAAAAAAATAGTSSSAGEVGSNSNAGEDTSSNAGEGTSLNAGEGTNSNTSGGTSPSAGEGTSTDPQDTSTKSSAKSSETNKHSQELLNYYIQVARAILGGSTSLLKVALKDLMSNPRIGPVCPYFFNLIALSINKLPRHDWLTNALLSTVEAILENPYVDPSSYLAAKRTINSLLVIAIEPKVAKNCDDFLLRTRAARLLSEVLDAWNIDQKIQNDIVRQLMQLLLDKKISLQTQFGAIYSLISLEHFSLSSHFWPVIGRYIPILEEKQNSDVLLATQVGGCIQLAAAKMYIDEWTQDVTVDEWKRRLKVDHMLYEHFGDALVPIRQDFSITGPYFYSKPNGNFEESFPTEEEDQPTYDPTSAVNMEVEDTSSNNVTPAINFTKNSPIVFKIEHARQIELKMNRKLCSIQMPLYTESPKSFRSIWNRQTLYKNTRTIKYCVESHLKSPAGYLYLIL